MTDGEVDLVDLYEGKVVNKRWVVDAKLGEGACATVYKVHDIKNARIRAAMKVCSIVIGVVTSISFFFEWKVLRNGRS